MVQQPGSSRQQIIQNLHEEPCGVETCVVPAAQPSATQQRLRIHIPDPRTTLLLGQHLTSNEGPGQSGVLLKTVGDLLADIRQDIVMQSQGFMLLQSKDGCANPLDKYVKNLKCSYDLWSKVAAGMNVVLAAAGLSVPKRLSPKDIHDWIKIFATAVGVKNTIQGAFGSGEGRMRVDLYGQDGVSIMSPKGIKLVSMDTTDIFAGSEVGVTSGNGITLQAVRAVQCLAAVMASLESVLYAEVKAGAQVGIASVKGSVCVKGRKVEIGDTNPPFSLVAQAATRSVELNAKNDVSLFSQEAVDIKSGKQGVQVESQGAVCISAGVMNNTGPSKKGGGESASTNPAIRLEVGSYRVEVKSDEVSISRVGGGTQSAPQVAVKGEEIFVHVNGTGLKIKNDRVHLGNKARHMSLLPSGDVWLKGKRVNLG